MRQTLFFFFLTLFLSVYTHASDDAKGYKIVLASFSQFDDAMHALTLLGPKMGHEESLLQKKYHFEIVVRPSGKSFIISIEPLQDQTSVEVVLKHFKQFYPDAYTGNYVGPVVWQFNEMSSEHDLNAPVEQRSLTSALAPDEPVVSHEKAQDTPEWIAGIVLVAVFGALGIFFILRKKRKREENPAGMFAQERRWMSEQDDPTCTSEVLKSPTSDCSDDVPPLESLRQRLEKSLFVDTASLKLFAEPIEESMAALMHQLKRHIDKLEYDQALLIIKEMREDV